MTDIAAAQSGILQLHARCVDAIWRKDAEAFGECFAVDGEWKIAGMHMKGREEVAGTFAKLLGACKRVQLLTSLPVLDPGENGEVIGRIQCTEIARMEDGTSALTLGVYFDRYVEEGGRWRFRWRHWGLHYRGPFELSADFVDCPDYGAPPGLPGVDEPTFTKRFAQ